MADDSAYKQGEAAAVGKTTGGEVAPVSQDARDLSAILKPVADALAAAQIESTRAEERQNQREFEAHRERLRLVIEETRAQRKANNWLKWAGMALVAFLLYLLFFGSADQQANVIELVKILGVGVGFAFGALWGVRYGQRPQQG